MKNILKSYFSICLVGLSLSGCVSAGYVTQAPSYNEVYQQDQQITYQSFYDNLSPYGNWIDYPQYGHVWNPRVSSGFRPYATNGQWRYSNDGWAWQSNYNWGWAPFHYGRWLLDDNYGWLWVPGYDWSPAWVTWGRMNNDYAWAPLMPGVNINEQYNNYRPHSSYWNIAPRERIGDRNLSDVFYYDHNNYYNNRVDRNNNNIYNGNTAVYNNITIINNYNTNRTNNYYSKGPDVSEVERYTHNKIQPVAFRDVHQISRPTQSATEMNVYRPKVQNPDAPANGHVLDNNRPVRSSIYRPNDSKLNNVNNGNSIKSQDNDKNSPGNRKPVPRELSTPVPFQNNQPVMNANQNGAVNLQTDEINKTGFIQRDNNQQQARQNKPNQNNGTPAPANNNPVQQKFEDPNQINIRQQQEQQQQQLQQQRKEQQQQQQLQQQRKEQQQQQQQQQQLQQQRKEQQEQQQQQQQQRKEQQEQQQQQQQQQRKEQQQQLQEQQMQQRRQEKAPQNKNSGEPNAVRN